jgi:CheY-like chemotaxis protein
VLDLSKIEAGRTEIVNADYAPRELAGAVEALFAPRAHQKGVRLALEIAADVPKVVHGDAGCVRQVLSNLVGNARKFTEHGSVTARVARLAAPSGDRLCYAVHDTGIGISREAQGRLFAAFAQADVDTGRKYGGTGLGLAISKQLVELMGGVIGVTSEPGHGATFRFELPLLTAAAAVTEPTPAPRPAAAELRSARVLLVDDNDINLTVGKAMLEKIGCEAMIAATAADALSLLRSERFDVVLMDYHMPAMDGREATQAIREIEAARGPLGRRGARLPVIAVTADSFPGDRERILDDGFDAYLKKPYDLKGLRAAIERALGE